MCAMECSQSFLTVLSGFSLEFVLLTLLVVVSNILSADLSVKIISSLGVVCHTLWTPFSIRSSSELESLLVLLLLVPSFLLILLLSGCWLCDLCHVFLSSSGPSFVRRFSLKCKRSCPPVWWPGPTSLSLLSLYRQALFSSSILLSFLCVR